MKNKKVIIEYIIIALFLAVIITSVTFAAGAIFNAQFALDTELFIQKKYALYDFDIVKFSTIVALITSAILIAVLIVRDNKTKVKKKKIVRR